MVPVIDQLGKGAHVGIIRLRSLGDCVLTTPAITLLKRHRPDLRIGVVVEPRFSAIFEENPEVDDIIPPDLRAIRAFSPRLCLNFHGGTRSLWLTFLSGALYRAGFAHHRASFLYNVKIPRAQDILKVNRTVHTAEHLASAMFHLGVPATEIPAARMVTSKLRSTNPYAVFHAMASAPEKSWPAERFLQVAKMVRKQMDLEPIFIGATSDDLTPFEEFRTSAATLQDTKRLLKGASLFVGNDSGPAHMAAAFQIPGVVLFAVSDPVIWAPWKTPAQAIVSPKGMAALPVKRVLEALERLRVKA